MVSYYWNYCHVSSVITIMYKCSHSVGIHFIFTIFFVLLTILLQYLLKYTRVKHLLLYFLRVVASRSTYRSPLNNQRGNSDPQTRTRRFHVRQDLPAKWIRSRPTPIVTMRASLFFFFFFLLLLLRGFPSKRIPLTGRKPWPLHQCVYTRVRTTHRILTWKRQKGFRGNWLGEVEARVGFPEPKEKRSSCFSVCTEACAGPKGTMKRRGVRALLREKTHDFLSFVEESLPACCISEIDKLFNIRPLDGCVQGSSFHAVVY